jgi:hypothetical protein
VIAGREDYTTYYNKKLRSVPDRTEYDRGPANRFKQVPAEYKSCGCKLSCGCGKIYYDGDGYRIRFKNGYAMTRNADGSYSEMDDNDIRYFSK